MSEKTRWSTESNIFEGRQIDLESSFLSSLGLSENLASSLQGRGESEKRWYFLEFVNLTLTISISQPFYHHLIYKIKEKIKSIHTAT